MDSLARNLFARLDDIVAAMDELLDAATIDHVQERHTFVGGLYYDLPDGMWGPVDDRQRRLQRQLLGLWTPWLEQVELLFSEDALAMRSALKQAARATKEWLELSDHNFSIPATIPDAKQVFRRHAAPFYEALQSLEPETGQVIVVPDSNVLIRNADITTYGSVLGTGSYTVFLVPGVLREMDEHKVNHRNPAVREKARKFATRLKGWRTQGSLAAGVKVQGKVYVQVEGKEPDFDKTLSWLVPTVVDDQIVASILEVQRRLPTATVVLLTGDNIMLAKADLASIPTADTPDPDV